MMPELLVDRVVGDGVGGLVERRRVGERFPRVPVGVPGEQVELSRELLAVALYTQHEWFRALEEDERLLDFAAEAVAEFGVDELVSHWPAFRDLPLPRGTGSSSARGAKDAWSYAYRLCIRHWYREATSRRLCQGESAVALYASGAKTFRGRVVDEDAVELTGFLYEGVSRLGAERVHRLGHEMHREMLDPRRAPIEKASQEFRSLMPDAKRRRACHNTAVNTTVTVPRPLMVSFDAGGFAVGTVAPEAPRAGRQAVA